MSARFEGRSKTPDHGNKDSDHDLPTCSNYLTNQRFPLAMSFRYSPVPNKLQASASPLTARLQNWPKESTQFGNDFIELARRTREPVASQERGPLRLFGRIVCDLIGEGFR